MISQMLPRTGAPAWRRHARHSDPSRGKLGAQRGEAGLAMADVRGRLAQLQPDLVGALQRLRPVVVVVADVDALAQGRQLDLHPP
jgi:hypothetical protein